MQGIGPGALLPAAVTPFLPDGQVDERSLRRYMNWLVAQGASAVVVNADSGEGHHLWPEERIRILEVVAEEIKGKIPIVAGLIASFNAEGIKLAREAASAGADALMVFPLPGFRGQPLPPAIPVRYYREVAEASGLPLIAFRMLEVLGGAEYSAEVLQAILEEEQVFAIKDATFDAQKFTETVRVIQQMRQRKDVLLLTGNDPFILESLFLGAQGALIGFGTVATAAQVQMIRAALRQDYATARAIYDRLLPLEQVIFAPPVRQYRARLKVVLQAMGIIDHTTVRAPLVELEPAEQERVRAASRAAGAL